MKKLIRQQLREGLGASAQTVAKAYLKGLLNNVHNNLAKQFLNGWISRDPSNDMVLLSAKEHTILNLIKIGGILPKQFHPKN